MASNEDNASFVKKLPNALDIVPSCMPDIDLINIDSLGSSYT